MREKREKIEKVVRKCVGRLNIQISEEQIQSTVSKLMEMKDIKTVMDSLSMTIEQFLGQPEQKKLFEESMKDILALDPSAYRTIDEMIAKVQVNKKVNYRPRRYFNRGKSFINK